MTTTGGAPAFDTPDVPSTNLNVEVTLAEMLDFGRTYEHFIDVLIDKVMHVAYPGFDTLTGDDEIDAAVEGTEILIHYYHLVGAARPNVAIFGVNCTVILPDGVEPTPEPEIPEPTSTEKVDVVVHVSAVDAWEAWRVTVPADATKEWIEANWEQDDSKDMKDAGATSYTVTSVSR